MTNNFLNFFSRLKLIFFPKKITIKINKFKIIPRFALSELITIKVLEFCQETEEFISIPKCGKIKKIRAILEFSSNEELVVQNTIQYLVESKEATETWVNEDLIA